MTRKSNKSMMPFLLIGLIILVIYLLFFFTNNNNNIQSITDLTDNWINAVTVKNDASQVANLFCKEANLVGTVSQTIRRNAAIQQYFEFFAKLPNIKVLEKKYDIERIDNNVWLNTSFVTWNWDGLAEPLVVRMIFVFKGNCIFQLHGSELPEINNDLRNMPNY